MADTLTPEQRRRSMSRVAHTNTGPEQIVCSALHNLGYRFRKNVSSLPSSPDIVLSKYRTAIFVHGCFWHQHKGCPRSVRPKSNTEFWNEKLDRTINRDKRSLRKLRSMEWKAIIIWECELKNIDRVIQKLNRFIGRQEDRAKPEQKAHKYRSR